MKCDYCEKTDVDCRIKTIKGIHYCPTHLSRHYRGQPMEMRSIYDPNDIVVCYDYAEIILRDRKCQEIARAMIDLEDVGRCKQYKWHLRKTQGNTDYVIASLPNNKKLHLHKFVMECDESEEIDHINMDGLDNRKENLRVVTHSRNKANNQALGVKKVPSGRYQASFCRNYKTIYIGTFDTEDEALNARRRFIEEYDAQIVS